MTLFPTAEIPPAPTRARASRIVHHQSDPPADPVHAMLQAGGLKLEIHVHVHNSGPGDVSVSQVQQAAQIAATPAAPSGKSAMNQMSAMSLLKLFKVRDPERYQDFPRERVLAVVQAARAKKRSNIAGWIATALTRAWDVSQYSTSEVEVPS